MEPGTLLYDTATDQVGEYRDQSGPYAMLRPVGGGREWQAHPSTLRPATDRERLSAGVRAANDRSSWAVPPNPDDLSRPPWPVPGCAECTELGGRRETALVAHDHSAATDANVLLRQHQRAEHQP
ncbi:hypothetical protein ABT404_04425 [Streptomyces hyaluromycini]|jgi:hypothetical protein|uniref:Uncharacterized protein n=1 Tax=Streptomyces hyaluromycini TaxID=1377993 RepID=A0ABV1WQX5_9ACTN